MHLRRLSITVLCLSLLAIALAATPCFAQAIHEGKVTGTVVSEDNLPLPGANVEISGTALLGGKRTAPTNAKGTYIFLNLPVGKYTVTASRDAFKTVVRENVGVEPAGVTTVDFTLPVGTLQEKVMVTAESPIVDTKTSTIDSKIDQDLLQKLPTTRDAFYDLALTTPGMFAGSGAPSQATEFQSPTAYGSATNENVFLINGVDATNTRSGSFGSLVNVNYDTVEEVRIVALGSKAEYGSYSGAAIDVVTKSGSNNYHGSGAFYSRLGSPASNQPAPGADLGRDFLYVGEGEQLAGQVKKDWEGSATLGGPIVKEKLWFFGAFNYKRSAELPPRWDLLTENWGRYADLKLSAAPFAKHRAFVAYHYENNDATGGSWGSQPAWDTSMSYGNNYKNNTVSAQWQYFPTGTTSLSAKYLGFWTDQNPNLPAGHPEHPGYINWWKWSDYGINGAFPYVEGYLSSRHTIQVDGSHYADRFLGTHDIKFGVQYTKGRSDSKGGYFQNYANFLYPYRWTQKVSEMQSWYGDTGLLFYNNQYIINPSLTVRHADSMGVFLDDQWSPTPRLTINLGLRYDDMSTKYGGGKVYDFPSSPEAINDPPPVVRDRAGTGNVMNFKTWQPRLGLTYKLTNDGKTVARASFGRYYMPLSIETLRRFGPDMPLMTLNTQMFEVGPWNTVDTNGDGFIDAVETRDAARRVYGLTPLSESQRTRDISWSLNTAANLKDQYTDQFTFNLERELLPNFSVSGTYIFKRAGDMFANVPIERPTGQEWPYERIPYTTTAGQTVNLYSVIYQDWNGDGVLDGGDVQWIGDNGTSKVVNMGAYDGVKPKRDYNGFQLAFHKRYSNRWQALASVLYSNSSGMSRRSFRQDFNVESPMFYDDTWMGNLNYTINNLSGQLPFTPSWEVKLSGSYRIPKVEADFGARIRFATGRPMWKLEGYPEHTQWAEPEGGVINPGGLVQIVNNDPNIPYFLPNLTLVDLHLEKSFSLGGPHRVSAVIDGFNVFNVSTPINMDTMNEWGKVTSIPQSRRFRLGVTYRF